MHQRDYSICDGFAQLNKLDGFDLQPRVPVPFTGAIHLDSVNDSNFFISSRTGTFVSGLRQLTFDPETNTLAGISDEFLRGGHALPDPRDERHPRRHRRTASKRAAAQCVVRSRPEPPAASSSASARSMDLPLSNPRNAYVLAGFPDASRSTASRKLTFTQNGKDDVFLAASVAPSIADPLNGIVRTDQVKVDPAARRRVRSRGRAEPDPARDAPGYFAFGSFLSPRYQFASATGHQDHPTASATAAPTARSRPSRRKRTPKPFGADRLGVDRGDAEPGAVPAAVARRGLRARASPAASRHLRHAPTTTHRGGSSRSPPTPPATATGRRARRP